MVDDKRRGGLPEGMQMSSNEPMIIMLIEDDAGHAWLIERNLQRARLPHTLVVLQDGDRAVDYFFPPSAPPAGRTTPGVILLDLHLQGLHGLQVLARLKNSPQTRHIPVIILSTTEDPDTIETCYALGCNAYLTKPIDAAHFAEALQTFLHPAVPHFLRPIDAAHFAEALQTLGVWLSYIAIPKGKPSCA